MMRPLLLVCLLVLASATVIEIKNLKLFVDGTEFWLKTVAYNPVPLGTNSTTGLCSPRLYPFSKEEYTTACYDSDYMDGASSEFGRVPPGPGGYGGSWFKAVWERDFPLITELGFNSIRLYNAQPATQDATLEQETYTIPMGKSHIEFLDYAHSHGLKVLFPLYGDQSAIVASISDSTELKRLIANQIDEVGYHPAIVMYTFGNELGITGDTPTVEPTVLNPLYSYIRGYQKAKWNRFIPVTSAVIDLPTSYASLTSILDVDVFTTNAGYRGVTYTDLFTNVNNGLTKFACQQNKPIFIGEFGAHFTDQWVSNSYWFTSNWGHLINHTRDGVIGGAFFEWNNEPFKPSGAEQRQMGIVDVRPSADSFVTSGWTPDLVVRKRGESTPAYNWTVISGEDGSYPNLKTNVFSYLGRSPSTSGAPGPDICGAFGGLSAATRATDNIVLTPYSLPTPLARYSFDDNLNDATGTYNGIAGGAISYGTGINGSALLLTRYPGGVDTGNQFVNTGLDAQFDQKVTVMAWIKLVNPSSNDYMKIISCKDVWDGMAGWEIEYNPFLNRLSFIGAGEELAVGYIDLDANWHHIAVSVNWHIVRMYVDGTRFNSDQYGQPLSPNTGKTVRIGNAGANPLTNPGGAFTGSIDEVWIWNKYIPETGVKKVFDSTKPANFNPITVPPTTIPSGTTTAPTNPTATTTAAPDTSTASSLPVCFFAFLLLLVLCL